MMPGTKIEAAINSVADAVVKSDGNAVVTGSMGFKSVLASTIGNMSAMALISLVMWVQFRDNASQTKYDRDMFRDELKSLRASQENRWEKTDATHTHAMEKMGATIERATTSLESATKEIHDASRRIGKSLPAGGAGN